MLMGNDWANSVFGPFAGAIMLLFWIGVVLSIAMALRWVLTRPSAAVDPQRESAHEMVDRRFANGEIDAETHQKMHKQLGEPQE